MKLSHSLLTALTGALALPAAAHAPDGEGDAAPPIIVTAPGIAEENGTLDIDAADISSAGTADLLGALDRGIAAISLSDAQNNPYQPNLVHRGFAASPLQGNAQGLAVYLDGARFNQPFGDTVDFDLLPDNAIRSVRIAEADPVYGLNALGGALVVETETGRSAPGFAASVGGGDHGRREAEARAGWAGGQWSLFAAGDARHDGGWRRHSPSTLYNLYADLGRDGAGGGLHLKLVGAGSDLTGNGSSPVELLAADRRAVFTFPDNTRNSFGRISLHPWLALGGHSRLQASLYYQHLLQRTVNGDAADVDPCAEKENEGLLCLERAGGDDDEERDDTPLLDHDGNPIPDTLGGEGYGVLNRTRTASDAFGVLAQLVDRRALFGGENLLVAGASHDRGHSLFDASTELGALTGARGVDGLGPIIDQPDGAIATVGVLARTRYTGLFLSERLPLGAALSATLNLRWNEARVLLDDRTGAALDGRHLYRRLNPGAELAWRFGPGLTLRAGYAEANRAPTPAELACAGPESPCSLTNFFVGDPDLDQVVARTWQASASGGSGGAWTLRWTAAAWRATNANDIQFLASDIRGRAFFRNVGDTRRQGIEAELDATRGPWTVRAGYAFTDATFRTPLVLDSPDNPAAGEDGTIEVEPGDRLPGIPRHRVILSVDYRGRGFSAGGGVRAQSGQILFGDEGNDQPKTKAFALVDARASLHLLGPLSAFAEVTNLLDRAHSTFGTFSETGDIALEEAPGATDPRSLGPGAPRRWRAGIRAAF